MPKFEQVNPLAFPLRGSVFQAMGLQREAAQEFAYGKHEANIYRHGLDNAIEITNQHIAKYQAVPRSATWRQPAGAGHAAGMKAFQGGQHRTAIAHFDAELRAAPDRIESIFFRGIAYYRLRQYARAADDMQSVLRLDPQHAGAANYMGMATWSFGDREGAIRHYSTAIRLQPKWSTPYYNRSLALVAAKDLRGALSDLNMALQIDPKYSIAIADRAMVHYRQGNPAAAMADLKSAIALNPRAARLYCNMGVIVADQNRALAQQWYDRCYSIDPLERAWFEGQERWADAYMAHQRRMADIMAAIAANPSSSSSSGESGCSSPGACSANMAGDTAARQRFENNHPSSADRSRYGPY
jgi:tetratricopeptide (TPR) repeat protein